MLVPIFKSLSEQVEGMRNLHKKNGHLSSAYLHAERMLLNVQIATLTTFELSLKGSQSPGASNAKTDSTATTAAKAAAGK